jgi:hypothetical protein
MWAGNHSWQASHIQRIPTQQHLTQIKLRYEGRGVFAAKQKLREQETTFPGTHIIHNAHHNPQLIVNSLKTNKLSLLESCRDHRRCRRNHHHRPKRSPTRSSCIGLVHPLPARRVKQQWQGASHTMSIPKLPGHEVWMKTWKRQRDTLWKLAKTIPWLVFDTRFGWESGNLPLGTPFCWVRRPPSPARSQPFSSSDRENHGWCPKTKNVAKVRS